MRPKLPLSLRWRLALLHVGVVAVALGAVGAFLITEVEQAVIEAEVSRLAQAVQPAFVKPGASGRAEDDPQRVAAELARILAVSGLRAAVFDATGREVTAPAAFSDPGGEPLPDVSYELMVRQVAGGTQHLVTSGQDRRELHVFVPIPGTSGVSGLVQISAPLTATDELIARVRAGVLVSALLGAIAAAALGLLLLRIALSPLERIVRSARRVAAGNFSERVRSAGRDEIGQLAATFDQMLDRIEASLNERRRGEERARRFAADASHELRSPLAALGAYADVLLSGLRDDPDTGEVVLLSMRAEVDRMARLVDDLLLLARLDAGAPMRSSRVDLVVIARELAEQYAVLAGDVPVEVHAQGAADAFGDPDQLRRLLRNLLDNAVRHSPAGYEVVLSLRHEAGQVRMDVTDRGPGIGPEHLPHVFERFYRTDTARDRATGSSGLGLAIVRSIAEAHGGSASAVSTPGAGAIFTVRLPVADPSQPAAPTLTGLSLDPPRYLGAGPYGHS
ncbi:MAG: ATP-binding protein [Chloroflexota bacterium]